MESVKVLLRPGTDGLASCLYCGTYHSRQHSHAFLEKRYIVICKYNGNMLYACAVSSALELTVEPSSSHALVPKWEQRLFKRSLNIFTVAAANNTSTSATIRLIVAHFSCAFYSKVCLRSDPYARNLIIELVKSS